ncbi:interleukin-1 receptor type 2 isoform X2 [Choloepus didactylus]|uniref:interleukin-1 receptor type 2 isoform X2 n=1 Tax=Choloepus didactylus TaxID=27675 RepID=UPI00189EC57E|nr:interleukin-1 receptor type 2 isoform X2 [Choloepus didactylus]
MQSCRLLGAGLQISPPSVLRKLSGKMFLLYMLVTGVSAFAVEPEESTAVERNCQFQGTYFKIILKAEGEPVVLKCPQMLYGSWTSARPHFSVTWHKNDSGVMVSAGEERRELAQDGALWILPALQGDSGTYVCTVRNASFCEEMSVELRVLENTEASLPFISYPQILTLSTSDSLVCPELSDFTRNKTDLKIQWYKDSVLLDQDNEKFLSVKGTPRLLIRDVSAEDVGYYSCGITFVHKDTRYNITRNIELRVNRSRLTIPCKVFLGSGTQATTLLWWTANDTSIEIAYEEGRVTEGQRQEYSENNENYIEVPLIFDPVIREDLNTEFKCEVVNSLGFQTLQTTVKEASTFSCEIALAPLLLVFLVVGEIWIHKWWKHRARKARGLIMFKTDCDSV